MRWYVIASANFHCFIWSNATPSQPRTYVAGTDALDPQYYERPDDLAEADRIRYFDPIELTDAEGKAAEWLVPYVPVAAGPVLHPVTFSPRPDSVQEQQI